jgi:hypothetical protein
MSKSATRYVATLGKSGVEDPAHQLLYHYTDAKTALEKVLTNRTLRFTPSLSMSDPLESSPPRIVVVDPSGSPYGKDTIDHVNTTLDGLRSRFRQLSLTMDATGFPEPLGRGYARARMWDRYGASQSGVCLAFDANTIVEEFLDSARRFGVVNCHPVDYGDDLATDGPTVLRIGSLDDDNYADVFTNYVMANESELFFTKLLEWEGEFEYRFLMATTDSADSPVDVPFGSALRAIILGERFAPELLPKAREIAAKLLVLLVRLHWDDGMPSVIDAN